MTGIVIGGFGLGSLIFNQVGTALVNPDNLRQIPFYDKNSQQIVKQYPEEVSERFPMMLRQLALYFGVVIFISFALITVQKEDDVDSSEN